MFFSFNYSYFHSFLFSQKMPKQLEDFCFLLIDFKEFRHFFIFCLEYELNKGSHISDLVLMDFCSLSFFSSFFDLVFKPIDRLTILYSACGVPEKDILKNIICLKIVYFLFSLFLFKLMYLNYKNKNQGDFISLYDIVFFLTNSEYFSFSSIDVLKYLNLEDLNTTFSLSKSSNVFINYNSLFSDQFKMLDIDLTNSLICKIRNILNSDFNVFFSNLRYFMFLNFHSFISFFYKNVPINEDFSFSVMVEFDELLKNKYFLRKKINNNIYLLDIIEFYSSVVILYLKGKKLNYHDPHLFSNFKFELSKHFDHDNFRKYIKHDYASFYRNLCLSCFYLSIFLLPFRIILSYSSFRVFVIRLFNLKVYFGFLFISLYEHSNKFFFNGSLRINFSKDFSLKNLYIHNGVDYTLYYKDLCFLVLYFYLLFLFLFILYVIWDFFLFLLMMLRFL